VKKTGNENLSTVAAVKTQTLRQRQIFGFVNGTESDVSRNVTQTLSTLIFSQWLLYSHRPSVKHIFANQIIAAFQKLRAILT
jgi:hypothetical protein